MSAATGASERGPDLFRLTSWQTMLQSGDKSLNRTLTAR